MRSYSVHDVTSNGIQIHYYRSTPPGGAPPVLLLHGVTDNAMCWVRVAEALGGAYDLILPDTRGHGFSEKPAAGYTIEERAADVAGLIDALRLNRPVLIGHSLGGQAATATAALYPERVGAVVLEDPAWFEDEPQENRVQQAEAWCADLRRSQRLGRAGLIAFTQQNNPGWHPDERTPWVESKMQVSEQAVREIFLHFRPGWQGFVRQIQCPILLLTGDDARSILVSPAIAQEAAALNPQVREAHIAQAGHVLHRDQFEAYISAVQSFLAQIS